MKAIKFKLIFSFRPKSGWEGLKPSPTVMMEFFGENSLRLTQKLHRREEVF